MANLFEGDEGLPSSAAKDLTYGARRRPSESTRGNTSSLEKEVQGSYAVKGVSPPGSRSGPQPKTGSSTGPSGTPGSTSEEGDVFAATASSSGTASVAGEAESETSVPQLSVVQDAALTETVASQDALNREALTTALADFLTRRSDAHALALALFGPWGSGKSSFIDFVRTALRLRQPGQFRFAEFNAWKSERVDNIGAALAQRVVEELVSDLGLGGQLRLALKMAWRRKHALRKALANDVTWFGRVASGGTHFISTVLIPLVSAPALVALVVYVLARATPMQVLWQGGLTIAAAVLTAIFSVNMLLSKELLGWFAKLAKDQKFSFKLVPDYREMLGSNDEMSRTLEDLCSLRLGEAQNSSGEFLLLVVDDLDRCSANTIKQVFDAVRLVAHIPRVVVVVALDQRIAYSAVSQHYGGTGKDPALVAHEYLAKVFNVFVALPPASLKSIERYVRTRLFEAPQATMEEAVTATAAQVPATSPQNTSALEVDTFAKLAREYRLSNPRELWRLRQSWTLLKSLALGAHATDAEVRTWLRHLFFREVFLRGGAAQRKAGERLLASLARSAGASGNLWSAPLTLAARELANGFFARDEAVMAVLLPAAPTDPWPSSGKTR